MCEARQRTMRLISMDPWKIILDNSFYRTFVILLTAWVMDTSDVEAQKLHNILAQLDPNCIDEFILDGFGEDPAFFPIAFPCTPSSHLAARTALYSYSSISQNRDQGYLILHRLFQEHCASTSKLHPIQPYFRNCPHAFSTCSSYLFVKAFPTTH